MCSTVDGGLWADESITLISGLHKFNLWFWKYNLGNYFTEEILSRRLFIIFWTLVVSRTCLEAIEYTQLAHFILIFTILKVFFLDSWILIAINLSSNHVIFITAITTFSRFCRCKSLITNECISL